MRKVSSLRHRVRTSFTAHPVSYEMDAVGSFPGIKAALTWSWPPSSAEVKTWSYTSTPPYVFMAWYLVKHRNIFALPYHLLEGAERIHEKPEVSPPPGREPNQEPPEK